jgi:hypothetical protein
MRVTAVATAALFGLSLPTMNVLAAPVTETVIASDGDDITVESVEVEDVTGITASDGGIVKVEGDVVVTGDSYYGVQSQDGAEVEIGGNVNYTGIGEAVAANGGNVTVTGDVISSGEAGILVEPSFSDSTLNGNVSVGGNVVAEDVAISTGSKDVVTVGGDATGSTAVRIMASSENATGSIEVGGTLKSNSDDGYAILIASYDNDDTETVISSLPEITIYKIDVSNENNTIGTDIIRPYDYSEVPEGVEWGTPEYEAFVDTKRFSNSEASEVVEAVKNAINYIIKADDQVLRENGVKIDGTTMTMADTVSIALAGGYALDKNNSSNITIVSEENGTIKIRLSSALGGTYIKAIQQAAQEAAQESGKNESGSGSNESSKGDENSQGSGDASGNVPSNNDNGNVRPVNIIVEIIPAEESVQESAAQSESAPSSDKYGAPEGTIKLTTGNASAPIAPAIEGAAAPARTVSLKVTELTSAQFQNAIVDSIASTPAGATLRIETDTAACFDRKMLESFATRSNIDVEVLFTYNGKKRRVVIPAGFDISKLLDEKGYCGFLRLADILGSQVIG